MVRMMKTAKTKAQKTSKLNSTIKVAVAGFFVATTFYSLFGAWLFRFNAPLFFLAVLAMGFCWALFSVVIAKLHRWGLFYLVPAFLTLCEWLKTLGPLGISYGNVGYFVARFPSFIQTADFGGVFAVSFVIYCVATAIILLLRKVAGVVASRVGKAVRFKAFLQSFSKVGTLTRAEKLFFVATALLVVFTILYGQVRIKEISKRDGDCPMMKVCAVQNNSDPWLSSVSDYERDVKKLTSLTQAALKSDKGIDIVLWPETAVVPSIAKHYKSAADGDRHTLVRSLLDFIDSQCATFVIGNFNATSFGDFNSVLAFTPRVNTIPPSPVVYSKIHLVPFTERAIMGIPSDKTGEHLWSAGEERTVFHVKSVDDGTKHLDFSTPICFEDTFGKDCKAFLKAGAKAFLSVSCDAWSGSVLAQEEHLAMAIFRSVECRVPSVRSSASGVTCFITSWGEVQKELEQFNEGFLICEVPVLLDD